LSRTLKIHTLLSVFVLITYTGTVFAQNKHTSVWYFGQYAGLDFNYNPPVPLNNSAMSTGEGSAVISDSNGKLLFYTSGKDVWDSTHILMPNGTGLKALGTPSQPALILPKPGSNTLYYIFTPSGNESGENSLFYSVVDMQLNNGKGDIIPEQKNVLLYANASERITIAKHTDGNSYWLISKSRNSLNSEFYAFKITSTGVQITPVISTTIAISSAYFSGHIKASQQGDKIATQTNPSSLGLFNFNQTTGTVSYEKSYDFNTYLRSDAVEFSSDGTKLYTSYFSGLTNNKIYQFDLTSTIFAPILIGSGTKSFFSLQLALDKKIYVAQGNSNKIGVINNPNNAGLGCNYQPQIIELELNSIYGFPEFYLVITQFDFSIQSACISAPSFFSLTDTSNISTVLWNFGDNQTSTELNPTHTYANAGTFSVTLEIIFTDNSTQTITKTIEILDKPSIILIEHE